jgi:hypothetical protein
VDRGGARLDDLPLDLVCANDANRANDAGCAKCAKCADVFRGVQLGVTPLNGCAVARLTEEITVPIPPSPELNGGAVPTAADPLRARISGGAGFPPRQDP